MVHALRQAHRMLEPRGHLVDLHPEPGRFRRARRLPLCGRLGAREVPAGALRESPDYLTQYRDADRAVARVLGSGLFTLRSSEVFPLRYWFRSLDDLDHTLATEWEGTSLPVGARGRLSSLRRRHPQTSLVVVEPFRLNVLQKR